MMGTLFVSSLIKIETDYDDAVYINNWQLYDPDAKTR